MKTEDYIKKAWASKTFTLKNFKEIKESCELKEFEDWLKKELTRQVFVHLAEKVRFKKTENEDGSVTYFACLDWLDIDEMVKDVEKERNGNN